MDILNPRNWPAWLQVGCSAWLLCTLIVIPILMHDLSEISRGNNADDLRD